MLGMNKLTLDPPLSQCQTLKEIADSLGIVDQALYNLRIRYSDTFPEPLRSYGNTAVYYAPDVTWFHQQVGKGYGEDRVDVSTGKRRGRLRRKARA